VVGDGQGGHLELFGQGNDRINPARAIQKRVLAVGMKMYEIRVFHVRRFCLGSSGDMPVHLSLSITLGWQG
jgi:hypothetical protein